MGIEGVREVNEIYRATFIASDGIYTVNVIFWEGDFWLVPQWLDNPSEKWSKPARIIRLNSIPHQKCLGNQRGDFLIPPSVPKAAIFGPYPYAGPLPVVLVEAPDIQVVLPVRH